VLPVPSTAGTAFNNAGQRQQVSDPFVSVESGLLSFWAAGRGLNEHTTVLKFQPWIRHRKLEGRGYALKSTFCLPQANTLTRAFLLWQPSARSLQSFVWFIYLFNCSFISLLACLFTSQALARRKSTAPENRYRTATERSVSKASSAPGSKNRMSRCVVLCADRFKKTTWLSWQTSAY